MNLKDTLYYAFGEMFPISGGLGNSIDTPIILDKDGPSNYVGTEYTLLKYIGELRGVTWKKISQALMEHNGRYIDQIQIETVELTDLQVITQIENYYFDIDYFFRKKRE